MNKNLSITVLLVTGISFILFGLGIVLNQPKYELIDIKGDKSNIGDVSFISKMQNDLYSNTQTITSKDGFIVKKNSKSIIDLKEDSDLKYKHNDLFKNMYPENNIYQSEKNIGYLQEIGVNYADGSNSSISFKIVNKNLYSNQIEEYDLTLPDIFTGENDFSYGFTVGIKDEDIYILSSVSEDMEYSDNGHVKSSGDVSIYVYKFNLNDKKLEKTGEFIQKKKENELMITNNRICFENDGKLYTTIESYPKDNKSNGEAYLIYYDMGKNKFEYMKESIVNNKEIENLETDTTQYSIEDGKLYLINKDDSDENYTKINQSIIDLKNNKLVENKTYKIENLNEISQIESFRVIDNKLYLCMQSYKANKDSYSFNNSVKNSIIVVDESNGDILYMGEYIENKPQNATNFILKNNEI
ncbi:hypothetical protein GCM10008904_20400 [Paraclostridium ghonii]|uniref:DUF5050 domain-containing protein n=1 Tax=Paraclostridium ghonii TaxID=29358 RepID=A0ABU0MX24_9FIRM|nr:hypothetical protein [Paeniclostridium ghonii]MDQ0555294.1 hypothetical protein [Paeniclostridium ghonii]